MICKRCGQDKEPDKYNTSICVDCAKAERNRRSYKRRHQEGWMDEAKEAGLVVWQQQPGETQLEYAVWMLYRDSYPGIKPTYRELAEKAGTTYENVKSIASRWNFQARMQEWIAECDKITIAERQQAILDMNEDHIDMARRLRAKMSDAINCIRPDEVKPSEISSLMKIATDLERKANIDSQAQELMIMDQKTPEAVQAKKQTKKDDLQEVVDILVNTGALGNVTQIGVKETREVVAIDDTGNKIAITQEE